ncbi:MAG TPA: hypothetical protein VD794_11615 [Flavisolibacter sp.]|nr:hypothetical protein [Flavisolibacter sp.]
MAKWKFSTEIHVPDADEAIKRLQNIPGIIQVNAVTMTLVKAWYDNRKIQEKLVHKKAVPATKRKKIYLNPNQENKNKAA